MAQYVRTYHNHTRAHTVRKKAHVIH
jgi:hypothetical protein